MTCTARGRVRAHELSNALAECAPVIGVDVLAPDVGPRAGWTLEATLRGACAPPAVLRTLERYRASIVDASPRGEPSRLIITVQLR